jgi:hypothetical protein
MYLFACGGSADAAERCRFERDDQRGGSAKDKFVWLGAKRVEKSVGVACQAENDPVSWTRGHKDECEFR